MKKTLPAVVPLVFSNYVRLALFLLLIFNAADCFGEWTKTIHCLAGHVYRDVRKDAGREEFCEMLEPGLLAFKDGPYRFWLSEGRLGLSGQYLMGREVDDWRECDRFNRCRQHRYSAVAPREEQRHGFKPAAPISYLDGKYVFDFRSCRSTWVTQVGGPDPVSLNIAGDYLYRCEISYLPQSYLDHGGKGSYICRIPFEVGQRKLASLDLLKELPMLGLPQFCSEVNAAGEPLMIRDGAWEVATTVDVECASVRRDRMGDGTFEVRLNQFASDLVRKVSGKPDAFNSLLCLHPIGTPGIAVSDSGRAVLTYKFSSDPSVAENQARCVAAQFKCPMPCP